jgi:hypothetical protein
VPETVSDVLKDYVAFMAAGKAAPKRLAKILKRARKAGGVVEFALDPTAPGNVLRMRFRIYDPIEPLPEDNRGLLWTPMNDDIVHFMLTREVRSTGAPSWSGAGPAGA